MDGAYPFMSLFPEIYPERRHVHLDREPDLIGIMIKSVLFKRKEEMFLCNGLVVQTTDVAEVYRTVHIQVTGLAPVVGYDLDLGFDQPDMYENWDDVRNAWSVRFAGEPVNVSVLHDDIKRTVNAMVFPLKSISLAQNFMQSVRGALTFGDFCPDRGYYLTRDGNTPAVCGNLMFGRTYFMSRRRLNGPVQLREFIYDHEKSEMEAKRFDSVHLPYFYRSACIDIETVFDKRFRDGNLRRDTFAHKFPYCTEGLLAEMASRRDALIRTLNDNKTRVPTQNKQVRIPPLSVDMPGEQHEITCVSLVILNTHMPKLSSEHHRKKLLVLYNKLKATSDPYPAKDGKLAQDVGIENVTRIQFFPCSGELALLEKTVAQLSKHQIDLLYMYNAEFDLRVLEQRVYFYAESEYSREQDLNTQRRCALLLCAWNNLFVRSGTSSKDSVHRFQFETVRYLEMYRLMLKDLSLLIDKASTERGLLAISASIETFNKNKAKLGHFKMDSCGLNVIDLYRVAETRDVKFECTSMKLNDVAPFIIAKARQIRSKPAKDARKLSKVADVSYSSMDEMIRAGGKSLFAVLVYNLVDSQLCARLAKALDPVSALFHRCRATLNIDVVVHGRGDMFGGFVQSIHSVQIPQLKYKLDMLRAQTGPVGKELGARLRWNARAENDVAEMWKGGSVCDPLTGLNYAGPGMGLELSFDFSSMYPSIMCALNISPETTVPWPPSRFPHDLSGWVCYNWEAEGFEYATLILKYDHQNQRLVRAPAVLASSVEHYLKMRTEFKGKLKDPDLSEAELAYYKVQEGECKVLANSFYGTAPHPCGPMISAHGRRQISLVNSCVSSFYDHRCPVVYGDTDSVMVSVDCGSGGPRDDGSERELNESQIYASSPPDVEQERDMLLEFMGQAQVAIRDMFLKTGADVPNFLRHIHVELVKDTLERMYVIGPGNQHRKIVPDPEGRSTEEGYPIYLAEVPDSKESCSVTEPFVSGRRVKLEYENSSSVYCHIAKKTYVSLVHNFDHNKMDISSISVKARGLVAYKSVRSPCDSALTETFIACVMKGDCVKMETDRVPCFTMCPWHQLAEGDTVLYVDRALRVDNCGRWLDIDEAGELLRAFKVERVICMELNMRTLAVSVMLRPAADAVSDEAGPVTVVRTLHKDGKYCMNHIFSRTQAIIRDLLACKASELISSQIGSGFFQWSRLIKSSKNKHFSKQTLDRLRVNSSSVKTSYMEIVKTWLKEITGLPTKPVQCCEYYKCKPCEAAFHRYPLNLQAESGCMTAMFGGSLICERNTGAADPDHGLCQTLENRKSPVLQEEVASHPHRLLNNSRVFVAHLADKTLMNASGKLVAHCIVDYCLPGRMYSGALQSWALEDCKKHLRCYVAAVRARLKRAGAAFTAVMNNCPEHMIPASDASELEDLRAKRENVTRLSGEKLEACRKLVQEDMFLNPARMYESLCTVLKEKLETATTEGTISLVTEKNSASQGAKEHLRLCIPRAIGQNAGLDLTFDSTLYVTESELRERNLVDLASVLYQVVVMLQVHNPDAFGSDIFRYPDNVLYIMPYSSADIAIVQKWITVFKSKKWLKPRPVQLGKRKSSHGNPVDVSYHCVGCKNFYMDLFVNKVTGQTLMQLVYDHKKIRRIGQCISERRWLS